MVLSSVQVEEELLPRAVVTLLVEEDAAAVEVEQEKHEVAARKRQVLPMDWNRPKPQTTRFAVNANMHNVNTHNELKLIVSVLAVLFFLQDRCRSFAFILFYGQGAPLR